jgi:hypothetical protein
MKISKPWIFLKFVYERVALCNFLTKYYLVASHKTLIKVNNLIMGDKV